jgi:hypothetical protein
MGDDTLFHLNRIEGIKEGILAGQFPVRIHAFQMDGIGYPAGVFYPELFLYIPATLRLAGLPLEISYKIFCVLIHLGTVFISWYSFRVLSGSRQAGAFGAVLYLSFWYYLLDVYVRGALGEQLAMMFLPLALTMTLQILHGNERYWPMAVLAYTGILQSHLLSTCMVAVLVFLAGIWYCKGLLERKRLWACSKTVFFTLWLNLWFLVPFFTFYSTEKLNITAELMPIQSQGWSIATLASMIVILGIPSVFSMYVCLRQHYKKARVFFVSGVLFLIASLDIFPWDAMPGQSFIRVLQFPWRFMAFAAVCFAFYGGLGVSGFLLRGHHVREKTAVFCLSACILAISFLEITVLPLRPVVSSSFLLELPSYGTALGQGDDYLYQGMHSEDTRGKNKLTADDAAEIYDVEKRGTTIFFSYEAKEDTAASLPFIYYPGYEAMQDGKKLTITEDTRHFVQVLLPAGKGRVDVSYAGLVLFQQADMVSFTGLCLFLLCIGRRYRVKRGAWKY